jgi:predicted amidohydrolase YtcJ
MLDESIREWAKRGPAYTLKLDHLLGSIDVGKFADFAVLDDDPLAVLPERLKGHCHGNWVGSPRQMG